jgi:hypothetical protein
MNSPIFIFSAGWRSGSTLLQRMITASGKALIWGEAGGALNQFADAMERYRQMLGAADIKYKYGYGGRGDAQYQELLKTGEEIAHKWIACLNPPREVFHEAFRSFLESIYGIPARELGYPRWGIKEVQADIEAAHFLRDLYPKAKFIFLVRNPIDCLISIKRRHWMDCPAEVDPVTFFANHWLKLAKEFRGAGFGYSLKYEALINSPEVMTELSDYLEINSPENFIKESNVNWNVKKINRPLSFIERRRIMKIVRREMELYGYEAS